jgi:hypothetical protein
MPHWTIYDAHGQSGEYIAESLKKALHNFENITHPDADCDSDYDDLALDGWGQFYSKTNPRLTPWTIFRNHQESPMYPKVKNRLFLKYMTLMQNFLKLAEKYPKCRWYSDNCHELNDSAMSRQIFTQTANDCICDDTCNNNNCGDTDTDQIPDIFNFEPESGIPIESASLMHPLIGIKQEDRFFYFTRDLKLGGNRLIESKLDALDMVKQSVLLNHHDHAKAWLNLAFLLPHKT